MQNRFLAFLPFLDPYLTGENTRIYTDVGERLGKTKRAPRDLTIFTRLGRDTSTHVYLFLFFVTPLMDRGQCQVSGQAGGCRPTVDPSDLERS
jgi:hypothetical protein